MTSCVIAFAVPAIAAIILLVARRKASQIEGTSVQSRSLRASQADSNSIGAEGNITVGLRSIASVEAMVASKTPSVGSQWYLHPRLVPTIITTASVCVSVAASTHLLRQCDGKAGLECGWLAACSPGSPGTTTDLGLPYAVLLLTTATGLHPMIKRGDYVLQCAVNVLAFCVCAGIGVSSAGPVSWAAQPDAILQLAVGACIAVGAVAVFSIAGERSRQAGFETFAAVFDVQSELHVVLSQLRSVMKVQGLAQGEEHHHQAASDGHGHGHDGHHDQRGPATTADRFRGSPDTADQDSEHHALSMVPMSDTDGERHHDGAVGDDEADVAHASDLDYNGNDNDDDGRLQVDVGSEGTHYPSYTPTDIDQAPALSPVPYAVVASEAGLGGLRDAPPVSLSRAASSSSVASTSSCSSSSVKDSTRRLVDPAADRLVSPHQRAASSFPTPTALASGAAAYMLQPHTPLPARPEQQIASPTGAGDGSSSSRYAGARGAAYQLPASAASGGLSTTNGFTPTLILLKAQDHAVPVAEIVSPTSGAAISIGQPTPRQMPTPTPLSSRRVLGQSPLSLQRQLLQPSAGAFMQQFESNVMAHSPQMQLQASPLVPAHLRAGPTSPSSTASVAQPMPLSPPLSPGPASTPASKQQRQSKRGHPLTPMARSLAQREQQDQPISALEMGTSPTGIARSAYAAGGRTPLSDATSSTATAARDTPAALAAYAESAQGHFGKSFDAVLPQRSGFVHAAPVPVVASAASNSSLSTDSQHRAASSTVAPAQFQTASKSNAAAATISPKIMFGASKHLLLPTAAPPAVPHATGDSIPPVILDVVPVTAAIAGLQHSGQVADTHVATAAASSRRKHSAGWTPRNVQRTLPSRSSSVSQHQYQQQLYQQQLQGPRFTRMSAVVRGSQASNADAFTVHTPMNELADDGGVDAGACADEEEDIIDAVVVAASHHGPDLGQKQVQTRASSLSSSLSSSQAKRLRAAGSEDGMVMQHDAAPAILFQQPTALGPASSSPAAAAVHGDISSSETRAFADGADDDDGTNVSVTTSAILIDDSPVQLPVLPSTAASSILYPSNHGQAALSAASAAPVQPALEFALGLERPHVVSMPPPPSAPDMATSPLLRSLPAPGSTNSTTTRGLALARAFSEPIRVQALLQPQLLLPTSADLVEDSPVSLPQFSPATDPGVPMCNPSGAAFAFNSLSTSNSSHSITALASHRTANPVSPASGSANVTIVHKLGSSGFEHSYPSPFAPTPKRDAPSTADGQQQQMLQHHAQAQVKPLAVAAADQLQATATVPIRAVPTVNTSSSSAAHMQMHQQAAYAFMPEHLRSCCRSCVLCCVCARVLIFHGCSCRPPHDSASAFATLSSIQCPGRRP